MFFRALSPMLLSFLPHQEPAVVPHHSDIKPTLMPTCHNHHFVVKSFPMFITYVSQTEREETEVGFEEMHLERHLTSYVFECTQKPVHRFDVIVCLIISQEPSYNLFEG